MTEPVMQAPRTTTFPQVKHSVSQLMLRVLLALLPGIALQIVCFGPALLITLAVSLVGCLALEAGVLVLRRRPVLRTLGDGSAAVTAVLLALSIPPQAPVWLVLMGCGFAILLAKHAYGGLGYNPFNPAMVAYAALLVSFPQQMTAWPAPLGAELDAVSSATALDHLRSALGEQRTLGEMADDPAFGVLGASGWEWPALGYLLGGLYLLQQRVIRWQIPLSMLLGMGLMALVFWAADSDRHASPLFHLFSGATLLGAFFIATDPVSAATTARGRLLYGFGIGVLVYVIRSWGSYPDGLAFAVLLFNLLAPTLDRYSAPRVHGQPGR